jgi:hypothetical protein
MYEEANAHHNVAENMLRGVGKVGKQRIWL